MVLSTISVLPFYEILNNSIVLNSLAKSSDIFS